MTPNEVPDHAAISILVVDDEKRIRDVLSEFFSGEGYTVFTTDNGSEALKILKEESPYIVFLDIRMPDFDGLQCLKTIRERFPSVQVVMMSGFATMRMAESALKHGAFDYINKPFSFDHLKTVINHIEQTKFLEIV